MCQACMRAYEDSNETPVGCPYCRKRFGNMHREHMNEAK